MPKDFQRKERVGDLIQRELAMILQTESRNGHFPMITVSAVDVTRDLAYAKIYVSTLGEEAEIKEVVKKLNLAASRLRYLLAQEIKVRSTPSLQFVYDNSILQGQKLSDLIDRVDPDKKG